MLSIRAALLSRQPSLRPELRALSKMLVSVLAAALLLPWCHALPAGAAKDAGLAGRQTSCAGVHILIARGTTEDYPGDMITLANLIIANNAGADYEDIIYPATFNYIASTQQGMNATKSQLTAYVEACPESRIVLLGYSQVSVAPWPRPLRSFSIPY